ncbi:MAG: hypothetical protein WA113_11765 [Desulfitobacteriaceae bacterium]
MIDTQKDLLVEDLEGWNKYRRQVRENRSLFLIIVFLISLILGTVFYLLPLKARLDALSLEKRHWTEVPVLSSGATPDPEIEIPTLDKLPRIIELCQNCLVRNAVEITSFNVERFSEKKDYPIPSLDYASLRMHFHGTWQEMETGLNELERLENLAIQIQEVVLIPGGGETLLRIYILNS